MGLGDGRPLSARYQSEILDLPEDLPDRDAGKFNPVPAIPAGGGGGGTGGNVPVGGTVDQVLTKLSGVDFASGWRTPHYLTAGGLANQVLTKRTGTDFDAEWRTPATPPNSLPTGGLLGAKLTKKSAVDFDALWRDPKVIDVRDYGAIGDGAFDCTIPIAQALAYAKSINGTLYFPAGTYLTDGIMLTNCQGLSIVGDGRNVSIIKARYIYDGSLGAWRGQQVLNVDSLSENIHVRWLTFDGSNTWRAPGQQGVVFYPQNSSFCHNTIVRAGEYAFFSGGDAARPTRNLIVAHNYIIECWADGINFQWVEGGVIEGNLVEGADDDCVALGYQVGQPASHASRWINVIGNVLRSRVDTAATVGRGILAERVSDCLIACNIIERIKQHGILLYHAGGQRCTRVHVKNNYIRNCALNSGHGIEASGTMDCVLEGNDVADMHSGNCIEIADWQNLVIKGGVLQQRLNGKFCRGIHTDDDANSNDGPWATSWNHLEISGVTIQMIGDTTAQCIFLDVGAGITMHGVFIDGVKGRQYATYDYINVEAAQVGTSCKITNCVSQDNPVRGITTGVGGIFVTVNNN